MQEKILYIVPIYKEHTEMTVREGYDIVTTRQKITLFVASDEYDGGGYITSEDNFEDFIGADIIDIKETNQLLEKTSLRMDDTVKDYIKTCKDSYAIFIDIETTKGVLQFVLYGTGDTLGGYYGTLYRIESEQLKKEGQFNLP